MVMTMIVATAELELRSGHTVLIDVDDLALVKAVGSWRVFMTGTNLYARRTPPPGETKYMHKFLTGYAATDHINGNGLDNRRANLRPATAAQNAANRTRLKGRSGYRGVSLHKCGRWAAMIHVRGRANYIGLFLTAEEAAHAYDAAALDAWGEYARPNFPRPEPTA